MDQAPYEAPTLPVTEAAAITPMMGQYLEIKAANPGVSCCSTGWAISTRCSSRTPRSRRRRSGIVLTKRGKHQGRDIPMCGVPVHAAQDYLKKLIGLGHRVAICEQVEDPAEAKKRGGKSPVKRDVVRLVTRGTITEDDLLPARGSQLPRGARRWCGTARPTSRWPGPMSRPARSAVIEIGARGAGR